MCADEGTPSTLVDGTNGYKEVSLRSMARLRLMARMDVGAMCAGRGGTLSSETTTPSAKIISRSSPRHRHKVLGRSLDPKQLDKGTLDPLYLRRLAQLS